MKLSTTSVPQLALEIIAADDAITAFYAKLNLPAGATFSKAQLGEIARLRKTQDELERQIAAKVIAIRAAEYSDDSASGNLDFIAQGVIDALLNWTKPL